MWRRNLAALAGGFFGCLIATHSVVGQSQPLSETGEKPGAAASPRPAKRVLYFGKRGGLVSNPDSADHREELIYRDSVGGTARIYYPSGKLRRIVPYLHFDRDILYGVESGFYETGEIKSHQEYKLNKLVGESLSYYPNGVLRRRIKHDGSDKPPSEYFTPEGKPRPAPTTATEKLPSFQGGGFKEMVAHVQRRVEYPMEALRKQLQGRVEVAFMVDEAGFIRHVHIVKSPSPLFNATVMRAVASLGRLTPGEQEGEPVEVSFTLPITFRVD
jgi:protein TonB